MHELLNSAITLLAEVMQGKAESVNTHPSVD